VLKLQETLKDAKDGTYLLVTQLLPFFVVFVSNAKLVVFNQLAAPDGKRTAAKSGRESKPLLLFLLKRPFLPIPTSGLVFLPVPFRSSVAANTPRGALLDGD
jgi:hypothetical protein